MVAATLTQSASAKPVRHSPPSRATTHQLGPTTASASTA